VGVDDAGELVRLVARNEERHGYRLDSGVAPLVIVDAAQSVDEVEVVAVLGRHPDAQVGHLEVVEVARGVAWPMMVECRCQCWSGVQVSVDGVPERAVYR